MNQDNYDILWPSVELCQMVKLCGLQLGLSSVSRSIPTAFPPWHSAVTLTPSPHSTKMVWTCDPPWLHTSLGLSIRIVSSMCSSSCRNPTSHEYGKVWQKDMNPQRVLLGRACYHTGPKTYQHKACVKHWKAPSWVPADMRLNVYAKIVVCVISSHKFISSPWVVMHISELHKTMQNVKTIGGSQETRQENHAIYMKNCKTMRYSLIWQKFFRRTKPQTAF